MNNHTSYYVVSIIIEDVLRAQAEEILYPGYWGIKESR